MAETLDQDVTNLTKWLRGAWRYLADPSLTSFDRREIRNCMKDAEVALAAGLRRIADREKAWREAERMVFGGRHLDKEVERRAKTGLFGMAIKRAASAIDRKDREAATPAWIFR